MLAAIPYEGVATDLEWAEIQRLCQAVHPGFLIRLLRVARARTPQLAQRHVGRIADDVLETSVGGVDARIPWSAVVGYAASRDVLVLLVGRECVPMARGFFHDEAQWQLARETVTTRVFALPTIGAPDATWRTVLLWLTLLIVTFLAWHFAQFKQH
jgi:hypothetical protein